MDKTPETALDYHYYTLGKILFYLAKQGLRRVNFDHSDAMELMDYRRGDEAEVIAVFHDVLLFMNSEGIIRVLDYLPVSGGYEFRAVQLTAKGLQLIQAEPGNADESLKGSIAANTASPQTASTDNSYYNKWGEFAGSFLASITKSIGSG